MASGSNCSTYKTKHRSQDSLSLWLWGYRWKRPPRQNGDGKDPLKLLTHLRDISVMTGSNQSTGKALDTLQWVARGESQSPPIRKKTSADLGIWRINTPWIFSIYYNIPATDNRQAIINTHLSSCSHVPGRVIHLIYGLNPATSGLWAWLFSEPPGEIAMKRTHPALLIAPILSPVLNHYRFRRDPFTRVESKYHNVL